jgi:hypothetical protein
VEKEIVAIAKDLWKKTEKDNKEHAGIIAKDKDNKIVLRNEDTGTTFWAHLDLDVKNDDTIIATIHTHPIRPGGPTAFGDIDILFALKYAKMAERDFVVTKGALYMLPVYDDKLAVESYMKREELNLSSRYIKVFSDKQAERDIQKRSELAVQTTIKGTGLRFHKGDDSYKQVELYK